MSKSKPSFKEKGLSFVMMFIIGFAGFSLLGAVILVILISLGFLPTL